jgi:tetratricopeptide (TPR) repeat protein
MSESDAQATICKQWPVPCDRQRLVKSINTVATTNFRNGKLDRALAFYEEALLLARFEFDLLSEDVDDDGRDEEAVARLVQSTVLLASTLNSIAVIRWSRGLLEQSKLAIDEAMEALDTSGPKMSALVLPTSPSSPRQREANGKISSRKHTMTKLFTDLKWVKCTTMFNQGILYFLEGNFFAAMNVFEATLHAQKTLLGNQSTDASSTVTKTQEYLAICRNKLLKA